MCMQRAALKGTLQSQNLDSQLQATETPVVLSDPREALQAPRGWFSQPLTPPGHPLPLVCLSKCNDLFLSQATAPHPDPHATLLVQCH